MSENLSRGRSGVLMGRGCLNIHEVPIVLPLQPLPGVESTKLGPASSEPGLISPHSKPNLAPPDTPKTKRHMIMCPPRQAQCLARRLQPGKLAHTPVQHHLDLRHAWPREEADHGKQKRSCAALISHMPLKSGLGGRA